MDGLAFVGTVTRHEAKQAIYKEALGCPFSNFRGVRFGYKGVLVVTFMLITSKKYTSSDWRMSKNVCSIPLQGI